MFKFLQIKTSTFKKKCDDNRIKILEDKLNGLTKQVNSLSFKLKVLDYKENVKPKYKVGFTFGKIKVLEVRLVQEELKYNPVYNSLDHVDIVEWKYVFGYKKGNKIDICPFIYNERDFNEMLITQIP